MLNMRTMAALIAVAVSFVFAGCSSAHPPTSSPLFNIPMQEQTHGVGPQVLQGGGKEHWVRLSINGNNDYFQGTTVGSDRNRIWVADYSGQALYGFSMNGKYRKISIPGVSPSELTIGADGNFWVNEDGAAVILRVTPTGNVTAFSLPPTQQAYGGIVTGPDGNVWFTEQTQVASITPSGMITQFNAPGGCGVAMNGITVGPDRNIWYAAAGGSCTALVRIHPSTGMEKTYVVPPDKMCAPFGIVTGPDGDLWFSCNGSPATIGKMTLGGTVTTYPVQGPYSAAPLNLAPGSDGKIYFIKDEGTASLLGRINPQTGEVKMLQPPSYFPRIWGIILGPDGNMWTDGGNAMGIYVINVLEVSPSNLTFGNPGDNKTITVTERNTHEWTATSSDLSVALVQQGSAPDKFVVNAIGPGQCVVHVKDAIGNIFDVSVLVM
jgi:streptogramin lyase